MKISIWVDERQLENLKKLINRESHDAVMFEKDSGYYPCDICVTLDYDEFVYLRDSELLVLEEEQF